MAHTVHAARKRQQDSADDGIHTDLERLRIPGAEWRACLGVRCSTPFLFVFTAGWPMAHFQLCHGCGNNSAQLILPSKVSTWICFLV